MTPPGCAWSPWSPHDDGEACVCELTELPGLTQHTISHHLEILVGVGIFTRDKRGVRAGVPGQLTPGPAGRR